MRRPNRKRWCVDCGLPLMAVEGQVQAAGFCARCWDRLARHQEKLGDWLGHPVFCARCGAVLERPADLCQECLDQAKAAP